MPSQSLLCTIAIDVSELALYKERKDVVGLIVHRFATYSIDAIQFIGTIAKVTFGSKAEKETVLNLEAVELDGKDCPIWGGGPRPRRVWVYNYPYEGDDNLLKEALNSFGKVKTIGYRHWIDHQKICDGVRVANMTRTEPVPRNLTIDSYHVKVSYLGQALQCDICEESGHTAKICPYRRKCLRCKKEGHYMRHCHKNPTYIIETERTAPPPVPNWAPLAVDTRDNELDELQSQSQPILAPVVAPTGDPGGSVSTETVVPASLEDAPESPDLSNRNDGRGRDLCRGC